MLDGQTPANPAHMQIDLSGVVFQMEGQFMHRPILLLLALSLVACAAQLTQEGRMVRAIQPDWATKCKFLGVLDASEGNGWDVPDDRRGALNSIRNQVAQMSGNAFVVSQSTSNGIRTLIQADAYNCP